jgi:hypothetical protein
MGRVWLVVVTNGWPAEGSHHLLAECGHQYPAALLVRLRF